MPRAMAALLLLLAGAGAALASQFGLDAWASASQLGDWVQHGVIFWGGIAAGLGVAGLYRQGRRAR